MALNSRLPPAFHRIFSIRNASWLRAIQELGVRQVGLFALYQLCLHSGYLRWATRSPHEPAGDAAGSFRPLLRLPDPGDLGELLGEQGLGILLAQADMIASGRVRLFGGQPVPLLPDIQGPLQHWTLAERRQLLSGEDGEVMDIKFIWEPGRFGWAYTLGRAYHLSNDERYAAAFWMQAERFLAANPPYLGPHWVSAQEVALRLVAFVFALQVFSRSPHTTPERTARLLVAIAQHARRIPPTLIYARSQNNNHLLTEAAGLYTAGLALYSHPSAARWRKIGWHWFQRGLEAQIAEDGTYVQHSANYQRLMLQISLWMSCLAERHDQPFPKKGRERLAAAARWLLALLDPPTGRVPNLGPNDGAYILPLTICPFEDYRPVVQAAALAFLAERPFPAGTWDEMHLWLGQEWRGPDAAGEPERGDRSRGQDRRSRRSAGRSPHVLRPRDGASWGYLRVAHFTSRPGHADQLHFDLWWRGLNVAQDAGTYLYNADPPWDNSLACSAVHNTVTIQCAGPGGQDQMRRAGRFLYLDWAQGRVVGGSRAEDGAWRRLVAEHDGYRRFGVIHRRTVAALKGDAWLVKDDLLPLQSVPGSRLTACLHWLIPDWPWQVGDGFDDVQGDGPHSGGAQPSQSPPSDWQRLPAAWLPEQGAAPYLLRLLTPLGWIRLNLCCSADACTGVVPPGPSGPTGPSLRLVRAGELLLGSGPVSPTWGWSSPTYGDKIPALSIRVTACGSLPLSFTSLWVFPPA